MPKIKFLRENKAIDVAEGANLREEALKAGVQLYKGIHQIANCHGMAQCGSCRVLVKNGTIRNTGPKTLLERARLLTAWFTIGHEEEMRLACQTKVMGDLEVETQPPFKW